MKVHVDNSWLGYLNSVTLDETWADNVVIQALAVSFNLSIRVVGSNELYQVLACLSVLIQSIVIQLMRRKGKKVFLSTPLY